MMGFALADLTEKQRVERLRNRLMRKVDVLPSGCWRWTGCTDSRGYGRVHLHGTARLAHRIAYAAFVGPIPAGMTLDHVCHSADADCDGGASCAHRSCINPAHLEPVTQRENVLRGRVVNHAPPTHCPQGHPYGTSETYWTFTPNGTRVATCRICGRAAGARYRARKRLERYAATMAEAAA